jgi:hypothetical protein
MSACAVLSLAAFLPRLAPRPAIPAR